jgi:hypothetical protein
MGLLILAFHVLDPSWLLVTFRGCTGCPLTDALAQKYKRRGVLTVKFRQPSHEFTFGVGMSFISYPLVLTPLI